jgi:hypothetical protein
MKIPLSGLLWYVVWYKFTTFLQNITPCQVRIPEDSTHHKCLLHLPRTCIYRLCYGTWTDSSWQREDWREGSMTHAYTHNRTTSAFLSLQFMAVRAGSSYKKEGKLAATNSGKTNRVNYSKLIKTWNSYKYLLYRSNLKIEISSRWWYSGLYTRAHMYWAGKSHRLGPLRMPVAMGGMFWEAQTVYPDLCPGFQNKIFSGSWQSTSVKVQVTILPSCRVVTNLMYRSWGKFTLRERDH